MHKNFIIMQLIMNLSLTFERIDAIIFIEDEWKDSPRMNNIIFYEDKNGKSELNDELMDLAKKSLTNKDARIQLKQIMFCIELLKNRGTRLPVNITKHIKEDIWELRPGNNRVLYFYFKDSVYVLLHMFRKDTQKTPRAEIEKAERECNDYKERNGGK